MRKFWRKLSLKGKLTVILVSLFVGVVVIALAISGFLNYRQQEEVLQSTLEANLNVVGEEVIRGLDEYIITRGESLDRMSSDYVFAVQDEERVTERLSLFVEETDFTWVGHFVEGELLSAGGELQVIFDQTEEEMFADWQDRYQEDLRLVDTDAREGAEVNRFITFFKPVILEGDIPGAGEERGFLAGQIPMSEVMEISNRIVIGETGRATIFNEEGILIGHRDETRFGYDMSHYPILESAVEEGIGDPGDEFLSGDGREKWGLTMMLEEARDRYGLQWGIIVDQTLEELYAPVTEVRNQMIMVTAIIAVIAGIISLFISRKLSSPLDSLMQKAEKVAAGNLSREVIGSEKEQMGLLSRYFTTMVENLRELVINIDESSDDVVNAADELSAVADETGSTSENIAQSVTEVAENSEDMSQQIDKIEEISDELAEDSRDLKDNVKTSREIAEQSHEAAVEGQQSIKQAIEQLDVVTETVNFATDAIEKLEKRSEEIGEMVELIEGIASQTNLLALNAAIEAARAGEQGQGFAVVAEEVRELAEESSKTAGRITSLIEDIQSETTATVNSMDTNLEEVKKQLDIINSAGESLEQMVEYSEENKEKVREVDEFVEALENRIGEINQAVEIIGAAIENNAAETEEVSALAEEQSASTEELAASADELENMARHLDQLIDDFEV